MFSDAPDAAARGFLYSAVCWLVAGSAAFVLAALKLISPGFLATEIFSYPRLQAISSITLIYGWLIQAALASVLYIVPRVTGARLASERAGQMAGMLFNAGIALGVVVTLFTGVSGREFIELPKWLIVVLFLAVGLVGLDVLATILRRAEPRLYVSLWYFIAALVWLPLSLAAAVPTLRGVAGPIAHFFALNGLLLLGLGAFGIGACYYILPRATGNPLYSSRLAQVGLWWLGFTAPVAAAARGVLGPSPDWLETLGAASSIGLLVVLVTLVANVFGTLHGAWDKVPDHPSLRFAAAGTVVFAAAIVAGVLGSFRSVARMVGLTDWGVAQVWLLVVAMGLWFTAVLTYAFPRLMGHRWFRRSHIGAHLWLTGLGAALVALGGLGGGLAAGLLGHAGAVTGNPVGAGEGFRVIVEALRPYRGIFLGGALSFAIGQWIFGVNVFRSSVAGEPHPLEVVAPPETVS